MKPGDHPEFFSRPPPLGRSRESTIRLDAQGCFWHDGARVEHTGMARAFASWIGRHPDDGRYILNNGYDWTYFEVEDVPYFVQTVALRGDEPPVLTLSDGSEEPLDGRALWLGGQHALYLRVKGGAYPARFTPQAQLALEPLLDEDASGITLRVGSERVWVRGAGVEP